MQKTSISGIEINPKLVGAIFTDTTEDALRVFCLYVNGDTYEFEAPLEENHESLHALYAQLDMLDKCSSAIVEQVVQGRFFARDEKAHWMYTILATTGSCAPRIDSHVGQLGWKRIWTAKGTDVLLLGKRGKQHCYAVRTEITEEDLHHTLKHSRAFVHPTPAPVRHTVPMAALAAMLVALGLIAGGAAWWYLRKSPPVVLVHARPAHVQPAVAPVMKTNPAADLSYFLLKDGKIQGPLLATALQKLKEKGEVGSNTLVRQEGDLDWSKLDEALKQ